MIYVYKRTKSKVISNYQKFDGFVFRLFKGTDSREFSDILKVISYLKNMFNPYRMKIFYRISYVGNTFIS
jgi:hypothetical protein